MTADPMPIQFLRVLGRRSANPEVLAFADGYRVWWRPGRGWSCGCREGPARPWCEHVREVADLLDPAITRPIRDPLQPPTRIR